MRDKCVGKSCNNFDERGCKGDAHPPWSWAKWYNEHDFTKEVDENEDRD